MLLSMVEDLRVILIKFADRLHNMRTLDHVETEQQKRISRETVDVYAPLAYRLGLARISRELEDLSLKYLDADMYDDIRRQVAMKREQREVYIEEFKAPIQADLAKTGIDAEITGRPKHFYSIYNKMKTQGTTFEEIYDLSAVRILVESVRDCYTTLGLVHSLYVPISDRFKDYIATPKTNMYQSLHTSVVGPDGRPVEIQIRTREMHQTAEIGIAAHWRYKSGETPEVESDKRIGWLRQVLDWQREAPDPMEFLENLKVELYRDEIYVFTPEGDLLQLPRGATTIDFAFAVHTDIGLHCLTAKVNGQIVPLGTELHSGDSVQIISSQHQHPTSSWLEMVKTGKARHWIGRWLREEQFSHGVRLGQEILERELKKYRHSVRSSSLDELAEELGLADIEHLYAAVGSGELSVVSGVVNRLVPKRPKRRIRPLFRDLRGIRIQGLDNMMIHFGKCCSPIPGDRIVGLITKGRGITVHRTDCPNMGDVAEDPGPGHRDGVGRRRGAFVLREAAHNRDRPHLPADRDNPGDQRGRGQHPQRPKPHPAAPGRGEVRARRHRRPPTAGDDQGALQARGNQRGDARRRPRPDPGLRAGLGRDIATCPRAAQNLTMPTLACAVPSTTCPPGD